MEDTPAAVIPAVPMWSENYAFMVNDAAQRIAIVCLIGRWTQDPTIWREFLVIGLDNERVLYHKGFGRAATPAVASAALTRIEVLQPGQQFRISFDGPIAEDTRDGLITRGVSSRPMKRARLELIMTGVAPVWDISGHKNDASDIAGRMHVEQVGVVSGYIDAGPKRVELKDAFGQRDHSRGVRIVTQFYRHCWAQGHFPKQGITFNMYLMEVHGGTGAPMSHATISRGERRYPATVSGIDLMHRPDDGQRLYEFTLHSELGDMHVRMTEIVVSLPKTFTSPWDINVGATPGAHVASTFEEAVRWEYNGESGLGWSERAFNATPFPQ
jgi:hypothetical protein